MSIRAALISLLMRHTIKRQFEYMSDDISGFRERLARSTSFSPGRPDRFAGSTVDADGVTCEWVGAEKSNRDNGVLMYLHGGGYVMGSPDSHRVLAGRLAKKCEARVLVVDYRLAPENPFPAALDDATHCYRWLLEQGYSPNKIAIGGDSAGGGLAVATMVNLRNLGLPFPCAGILLSPWADLSCSGESITANAQKDPMMTPAALQNMARHYLGERDRKAPLASPLFADLQGFPPVLVHVGSTEILLSDARLLVEKMKRAGVLAKLTVWPGMPHVFHLFGGRIPESRKAINQLAIFLNARMSGPIGG